MEAIIFSLILCLLYTISIIGGTIFSDLILNNKAIKIKICKNYIYYSNEIK